MKKLFTVLLVLVCAASATLMGGCDLLRKLGVRFEGDYEMIEVSNIEELKKANADKNGVTLVADLDFNYETISAFSYIPNFDGQGYTIKNCVISCDNAGETASFFGNGTTEVRNVTFDDITINASSGCSAAVVSAGTCTKIENVHVKNSKVVCIQAKINSAARDCFVGGIFGGSYTQSSGTVPTENFDCEIINCSVTDTEISVTAYDKGMADIYAGGIAGAVRKINGCAVSGVNITATGKSDTCQAYVGGAVGSSVGTIENSGVQNSAITVNNNWKWEGATGSTIGADSYIGGVVGACDNVDARCVYAQGVSITTKTTGTLYAGGVFGSVRGGSVSQSYSINNAIKASSYAEGTKSEIKRRIAGFAANVKDGYVTSCFAYNGAVIEENSVLDKYCDGSTSGFIGNVSESSNLSKCAVFNDVGKLVGYNLDGFSSNAKGSVNDCYTNASEYGNAANNQIYGEAFWSSEAIEALELNAKYWAQGVTPYLDFTK